MEKQLGWAVNWVEKTLWISKVGHIVLAMLMGSHMWRHYISCEGEGLSKGTMASACPNARYFNLSLYTTGALQADTQVLELRGSESE